MEISSFDHNPFVSAGIVFMLFGGILVYLRRIPGAIFDLIERCFFIKLEVLDEDEAYQWMQVWLADKLRSTLSLSVITKRNRILDPDTDDEAGVHDMRPKVYFVPAVGTYFFWYQGRLVTLYRARRESPMPFVANDANGKSGSRDRESFTLRLFSRDKALARQLIEECRERAIPTDGRLSIRVANYGAWTLSARVSPRPLASVVLDDCQAETLLADMRDFLANYAWYQATGVPYRRGYLLYGPPGNGKSSVVKALAGELGMSIYFLMLSDPEMNDNRISDLLGRVPDRNLLLLEDVDCAFIKRTRRNGRQGGLTFSGLLNALDGVGSPEGRIVVMTTNHIDRLDPALIRPGRADVKMEFKNATAQQARRLFERFFPDGQQLASAFASRIVDHAHSMAALQDYLMLYRDDPERALAHMCDLSTPVADLCKPIRKKRPRNGKPAPSWSI